MRKAGLKNRSRRKGSVTKEDAPPSSSDSSLVSSTNERRKPSNEEQALTAKNYRLAKELSDLRVRHRDETKNVTRLTLENMNLASRCREAISHVAMLKKELAMHQRRAAEALALQRQQTQRMASNVSDPGPHVADVHDVGSTPQSPDVVVEMDRMDRILASHTIPPPPPPKHVAESPSPVPVPSSQRDRLPGHAPRNEWNRAPPKNEEEFFASFSTPASPLAVEREESKDPGFQGQLQCGSECSNQGPLQCVPGRKPQISPCLRRYPMDEVPADEMMLDKGESGFTPTPIFPHSASPKVTVKNNYNEEFPADLDLPSSRKSFQAPLGVVRGVNDLVEQEEEASDGDQKGSSSIDAFEASFVTTFPPSFSTTPRDESVPPPASSEIYNPFFHSPNKPPLAANGCSCDSPNKDAPDGSRESLWENEVNEPSVSVVGTEADCRRSPDVLPKKLNSDSDDSSHPRFEDHVLVRADRQGEPTEEQEGDCASRPSNVLIQHSSTARSLFPESPMSSFEMFNGKSESRETRSLGHERLSGEQFTTPPHLTAEDDAERSSGEQPRRPEKAGAAAARARYEKALQPRVFGGSSRAVGRLKDRKGDLAEQTTDEVNAVKSIDTTHSPSLVLKRLQQRRVKDRTSGATSGRSSSPQLGQVSSGARSLNERPGRPGVAKSSDASTDRDVFSPSDEEDATPRKKCVATSNVKSGSSSNAAVATVQVDVNTPAKDISFSSRSRIPTGASTKSLSPDTMNAEIRALDAMASGSFVPEESTDPDERPGKPGNISLSGPVCKSRRNVKQPVSYAEPPLNSKLRRGDIYFPKGEKSGSNINGSPPIVSPTTSSPGGVSGSRTLPRPKNHQSVGTDEVLKDLGAAPAVRL